ncbi:hypothetical protein Halru_1933 [Halovivax ruber XH-70]|uniref:DUF7975 domain-containing protein n=1 Tax=Halovivax ruber (strain DSM 18193 / JCM 13892 / XH-70) TaxID=797302 RepID=L0IE78_HALRX|nr:hypothetical protein [Halovivax ruber]AGB16531.1 hypothetical protein Halru_1933 [Halovivax ruber XH-70]
MSRFDATTRDERAALIEAGIRAHRERLSEFCTFEADESTTDDGANLGIPWVQCAGDETSFDSTEEELDRVKSLLESYPRYQIAELHRPEDADGVHVIVDTPGELHRRAQFVDDLFIHVFERPESYRLWASAI